MQIRAAEAALSLAAEQSLRIESRSHIEIECLNGVLWITQPGDRRDLFVAPGAPLRLLPRGLTLVTAMLPAMLRIRELPAVPRRRPWHRWLSAPAQLQASPQVLQVGSAWDRRPGSVR